LSDIDVIVWDIVRPLDWGQLAGDVGSEINIETGKLSPATHFLIRWSQQPPCRSIIASVLCSIGKQLADCTLENVIAETKRWLSAGRGCFTEQLERLDLGPPPPDTSPESASLLDRLILQAAN